jgi:hypothetical protein
MQNSFSFRSMATSAVPTLHSAESVTSTLEEMGRENAELEEKKSEKIKRHENNL